MYVACIISWRIWFLWRNMFAEMQAKDFNYKKCIPNVWTQTVLDVLCFDKIYTSRGCGMRQAYQKSFRLASFLGKSGVERSFIWRLEKFSVVFNYASWILGGGIAATKLAAKNDETSRPGIQTLKILRKKFCIKSKANGSFKVSCVYGQEMKVGLELKKTGSVFVK